MTCPDPRPLLTGLKRSDLARLLASDTRARAVLRWLSEAGLPRQLPDVIPDVNRDVWQRLRASVRLPKWRVEQTYEAADGTCKLTIDLAGATVETVLIPGHERTTICLSSQAGCTRRCAFCATARLAFTRNLEAGEIVAQYLLAQVLAPAGRAARNVVFMGMGEPFDNLDAVLDAIDVLMEAPFPALSPGRITVSTSGVVPDIERFFARSSVRLALSLNATTDELRTRLMPHNRVWPIPSVLGALRNHAHGRTVFLEYVLLGGLNDHPEDAARLVRLVGGMAIRVNLIPFNDFPGSTFRAPASDRVDAFHRTLTAAGLRCIVRRGRGGDVAAACGQLAGGRVSPRPA